ncbi:epsin-2-like isoform X2 [Lampetra fluviatilis]
MSPPPSAWAGVSAAPPFSAGPRGDVGTRLGPAHSACGARAGRTACGERDTTAAMATSSMRRQMKNIVNKYSEAEVKVREATSNDAWGPSTSLMSEIADLSYNVIAFPEIMSMVWKRLNDHGKNWRHVYKALTLLDYLVKTGSERVAQQCRENIFAIQTLKDFQYVDRDGKDQGVNVRERAKHLVSLLKDDDRLRSERDQALKTKERLAQSVMGIGSGGERVTAHNGAHAHPHAPAQPHLAHGAPQPHLAHTTRSRPGSHNMGGTLMSPPPPDLDQVRPRNTGEEELQLQLALAMSKEEAEQEERMRRGDDLRLQMALEESRKDSVSPTSQHNGQSQSQSHSSLLDLADVFAPAPTQPGWQGAPAPLAHHGGDAWGGPLPPSSAHPHGGDAWGEASAGGAWGAPHPAAGPPALGGGPWGVAGGGGGVPVPGTLAAQARWQQPPSAAASIASAPSQDAWGGSVTAGASARSWQPPGPLPLTSVATTSAWGPVSKSPSDPWSAFPESPASPPLPAYSTSPPPIPAASADPWAPLDGRAKSATSSAAFDPFGQTEAPYREELEGFGRSGPTAPINTSAGELSMLSGSSTGGGAQLSRGSSPDAFELSSVARSLPTAPAPTLSLPQALPNPSRKTPESFLGPAASLVDLDALVGRPTVHQPPAGAAAAQPASKNPFLSLDACQGSQPTNPFQVMNHFTDGSVPHYTDGHGAHFAEAPGAPFSNGLVTAPPPALATSVGFPAAGGPFGDFSSGPPAQHLMVAPTQPKFTTNPFLM